MVKITLPDSSILEVKNKTTPEQIAEKFGSDLAEKVIAAKINGKLSDLNTPIDNDAELQIITIDDPEANALVNKPYRAPWKLEV